MSDVPFDPAEAVPLHRALGLTDAELDDVRQVLGREPNHLELALYGVMWSEHCSYKSSRKHLRRLPTTGPGVLVGPGENAGVVDAGDGIAVAIRIESHNHPSAIEPYQGAATGVGGILRDIFTMGARPLALMDPLFFGPLDQPRQRWLLEGVVSGISGYGNSVGVPTVGGELTFDPCYAQNPLVNVLCLGALPVERLVLGRASGVGNLVVLLGSTTGRDGIGGASVLASAGFAGGGEDQPPDDAKRPSVQVGDPFEEKRLIEACLALLDEGLVVGIQDLGAAGLSGATSETAARGAVGMDVDVSAVPLREAGMEPWEVMTSESQERMLAIVTPEDLPAVADVCRRWEVRATVVGRVTAPRSETAGAAVSSEGDGPSPSGRLRILDGFDGPVLADVPAASLADDAPLYDRPLARPAGLGAASAEAAAEPAPPADAASDLLALLVDPSWIYRQYDHQLFLNTVVGPGGDAALLRLAGPGLPPSDRGVAVSTDSGPRWCTLDPRVGTAMLVAEGVANVACVGARAVAVVNCLNFGNPEHPEVMWQLSEAIDGMSEACRALGLPVIGGNVSLYNESGGVDIRPTPVVGVLALVEVLRHRPPGIHWRDGDVVVLLGRRALEETGEEEPRRGSVGPGTPPRFARHPLGGSRWAVEVQGHGGGRLAPLDLAAQGRLVALVRDLVAETVSGGDGLLSGVHDVSSGGLGVALGEFVAHSGIGCEVTGIEGHAELFCELASRALVATSRPDEVLAAAVRYDVPATVIGTAGGSRLRIGAAIEGEGPLAGAIVDLGVDEVLGAWRGALPDALGEPG
jgi:phosphoribosylformylglycinamidine synthase